MPSQTTNGDDSGAARRVLERVQSDPRALEILRSAYRGRHDVLDAVWWRENPFTVAPSGASDPASGRRELEQRAFSRDGSVEAAAELIEVDRLLAEDRFALAEALQDAATALGPNSDGVGHEGPNEQPFDGGPGSESPGHDQTAPVPAAELWRRQSRRWMLSTAALTALLVAAVVSLASTTLGGGSPGAVGSGGSVPTATGAASGASGIVALGIFDDQTRIPTPPASGFDPYYAPQFVRELGSIDTDLVVYAALNRVGQPCLLAVYSDGTQSGACVSVPEFSTDGLQLRLTTARSETDTKTSYSLLARDVVYWRPTGEWGVVTSPARASGADQGTNSGSQSGASSSTFQGTALPTPPPGG